MSIWGIAVLLLIIGIGLLIHRQNIERIYKKISDLSGGVSKERLYEEISVQHGSNFSSVAYASWIAIFLALGFYMLPSNIPVLLSLGFPIERWWGLILFSLLVVALAGFLLYVSKKFPIWLRLSEIYNIYTIPRRYKPLWMLVLVLLWISSIISMYNSVNYPSVSWVAESYLLIVVSLVALLSPVIIEFVEAR